jgi:hypothetical protein
MHERSGWKTDKDTRQLEELKNTNPRHTTREVRDSNSNSRAGRAPYRPDLYARGAKAKAKGEGGGIGGRWGAGVQQQQHLHLALALAAGCGVLNP